jgi:HlyD family secretion protein
MAGEMDNRMTLKKITLLGWLLLLGCNDQQNTAKQTITGLMDVYEVDVATKVPGRIKEMLVKEGDTVEKNQLLLTIESHAIDAKMDQVRAATDAAKAKLKMAKKGARTEEKSAMLTGLQAAQHQVDITKKMYDRMVSLYEKDAIAKAKLEEVEFKYNMAKEQLQIALDKVALVKKGARKEEIEALEALVRQGDGTLAEVESYAEESTQVAPISGEVSKVILHPGELAATGYPIISIVDLTQQWATFSVREDLLKHIKKGDTISVFIPALGKTIKMEIFHISALGDFATWRATSEKNSFDLKSFEVRAKPETTVKNLRPGMTVRWSKPEFAVK